MARKPHIKAIVGMVVVAVLAGFAVADARDTDTSGRSRAALTVMVWRVVVLGLNAAVAGLRHWRARVDGVAAGASGGWVAT